MHSSSIPQQTKASLDANFSDMTMSWKKREYAFNLHHAFDLSSCVCYPEYKAATVVRNCIAHGLGELTAIQRKDRSLVSTAQLLDVKVAGNRMTFGNQTFAVLFSICERFILDVDARFPM